MERSAKDRFSKETIEQHLQQLPKGWEYAEKENCIQKVFTRKNFMDTIQFIERIAPIAEEQDHHPDLYLFGYKNLKVILSTHSAGGITQNDFDLARAIEAL